MRQSNVLATLLVPKGKLVSNPIELHDDTAVLTIYSPKLVTLGSVEVSADGSSFLPLLYKGSPINVPSLSAVNVPIPACKQLRVVIGMKELKDVSFQVLELLEL